MLYLGVRIRRPLHNLPVRFYIPRMPVAARLSAPSNLIPPLGKRSRTLDPLKIRSDT